jgi:hypothetical protein
VTKDGKRAMPFLRWDPIHSFLLTMPLAHSLLKTLCRFGYLVSFSPVLRQDQLLAVPTLQFISRSQLPF